MSVELSTNYPKAPRAPYERGVDTTLPQGSLDRRSLREGLPGLETSARLVDQSIDSTGKPRKLIAVSRNYGDRKQSAMFERRLRAADKLRGRAEWNKKNELIRERVLGEIAINPNQTALQRAAAVRGSERETPEATVYEAPDTQAIDEPQAIVKSDVHEDEVEDKLTDWIANLYEGLTARRAPPIDSAA